MLGCCQVSREKPQKDPKTYLKSHMMICMLQGNTVVYSIAEKKNNSGIMYNDRFLLLHGINYIGYFNTLDPKVEHPIQTLSDVPKMKREIPLKNILEWHITDKVLFLKFFEEVKFKRQQKQWVFKFDTLDLSKNWNHYLKKAEKQRKDHQRKQFQQSKKTQTIININKDLIEDRGIINTQITVKPTYPQNEQSSVQKEKSHYSLLKQSKGDQYKLNDSLIKDSSKEKLGGIPLQQQKDQQGNSLRIIDKTNSSRYRIKSPSPKSVHENSLLRQSRFSPIQNINAKSPSLNSSYHQSPSSIYSPPHSNFNSNANSRSQTTSQMNKQKQSYALQLKKSQVSPRWKQPVVIKQKWNNRLLKQNIPFVLYEFKNFSSTTSKQIVDNLAIGNPELKLRKKDELNLMVEYDGLIAVLSFLQNQSQNKDESRIQLITQNWQNTNNEFNNMEYVFSSLQNKLQPYVILTSLTYYKGILVHLFCPVTTSSLTTNVNPQLISMVAQKTRINSVWKSDNLIKSQQLNKLYLTQLKHYLPSLDNIPLCRNFIQLSDFQGQKFLAQNNYNNSKSDKKGEYISKVMLEHIKSTIYKLDNFNNKITNSKEFQQFLTKQGIHELQLGQLYTFSKNPYIKLIIGFECVFRVAKILYFKQLQMSLTSSTDMSSNLIIDKNILLLNSNKAILQITTDFLNSMVGKYKNAQIIWEIINNQMGRKYNIYNVELAFGDGYYLQGLIYHFNLKINWNAIKTKNGFDPKFTTSMISEFLINSKVYNCDFHLEFKCIAKLIQIKSQQNFKILIQSLDLHKLPIPEFFKLTSLYDQIRIYLSLFLSPAEEAERFKHLNLYPDFQQKSTNTTFCEEPPTAAYVQLYISAFKWSLKQHDKKKSLQIFDKITSYITRWLGQYHPYLYEIYTLLSSYYQTIQQHDQAITMAKTAIVNSVKSFGNNSIQLADAYIFLADIYRSVQKHDQSLVYERKAKILYDSNNQTQSIQYILMLVRIARLDLHFGKVNNAIQNIVTCLDYFDVNDAKQDYIVLVYQTAARCYELTKDKIQYKNLSAKIATSLVNVIDPLHLQKLIRIIIINPLKQLRKQSKFIIKQILDKIPKTISQQSYIQGYQYIRKCLKQDRFDLYVDNVLSNTRPFQQLQNVLQTKGRLSQNEKAIKLIQALRNFIGSSFISKLTN